MLWTGTRIEAWTSPDGLKQCAGEGTAKCGPCCADKTGGWCRMTGNSNTFVHAFNRLDKRKCSGLAQEMLQLIVFLERTEKKTSLLVHENEKKYASG